MRVNLAIDIGNSRSKFGLFEGKKLIQQKVYTNDQISAENEFFDTDAYDSIIISSVNLAVEKELKLNQLKVPLVELNHELPLPFKIEYKTPNTLGKDRIAAIAGGLSLFPNSNLLVIDAGSCITYDFLTATKRYLGGGISPGLQMRLKAMHSFTHALPLIEWEGNDSPQLTGDTTVNAMLSGVYFGIKGEINALIEAYEIQYPALKVVLTGGDAKYFEKELKNGIFADQNLVLKGLNEILVYNRD